MITQAMRTNLIKQQLRTGEVLDKHILNLYQEIAREDFVPNQFKQFAYSDLQIELPHGQRMMTPLEEGRILQTLALKGHETVLEIGTGTGFLTALLSRLSKKVISIDYYASFTNMAQRHLAQYRCDNVELITGDGISGWVDEAPYDVIIFSGAVESLADTQRLQILPGGKLFAIVGQSPVMQAQMHYLDHQEKWRMSVVFETDLPPLFDKLKSNRFVF